MSMKNIVGHLCQNLNVMLIFKTLLVKTLLFSYIKLLWRNSVICDVFVVLYNVDLPFLKHSRLEEVIFHFIFFLMRHIFPSFMHLSLDLFQRPKPI